MIALQTLSNLERQVGTTDADRNGIAITIFGRRIPHASISGQMNSNFSFVSIENE